MMHSVAILAGGFATRLRPITETIPKAMVPIHNIPFIDYQLNYLKQQGIQKVVLCLGHLGHIIKNHVGDGCEYGLKISYSFDGEKPLGTGGALIKALDLLDDNFFILYGDSFLPIEFQTIQHQFLSQQSPASMTIYKNNHLGGVSNVRFISEHLIEYHKKNPSQDMKYIDYGLSIVSKSIFKHLKADFSVDLADIFLQLSHQKQLVGIEVFKPFYEIGTFEGLQQAQIFLKNFIK